MKRHRHGGIRNLYTCGITGSRSFSEAAWYFISTSLANIWNYCVTVDKLVETVPLALYRPLLQV